LFFLGLTNANQGGLIIGGRTDYCTLNSQVHLGSKSWGVETPNASVVAQGRSVDGTSASYTTPYFTKNPGEQGAQVILGGRQEYWPLDGTNRLAADFAWGSSNGTRLDMGEGRFIL